MDWLEVVHWSEYQHNKKRDPPWIKLHRKIIINRKFGKLTDEQKWHLIGIWVLAAGHNGRVEADADWIASRIAAGTRVQLHPLIQAGFLKVLSPNGEPLKEARPVTDSETCDHPLPDDLKGLELYAQDARLCAAWPEFKKAMVAAYPGVDILAQTREAHAWEVANARKRKKIRTRFLNAWFGRQQGPPQGEDLAAEAREALQS
jgi:hypothetical protein